MSDELTNTVTADGGQQNPIEQAGTGDAGQVEQGTTQDTTQQQQERTFRQSELDSIIKDRIAREQQRFDREMKSNPVLSYLTQKAQRLGISVDQLIANDRRYERQQEIDKLVQQNIPPEYAKKLLEHDKIMNEYQADKQTRAREQAQQKMYGEFLSAYPDTKPEEIPPEVWQAVKKGETLLSAYTRYENKQLREKLAGTQQQQQTQQANEKNAAASTGSAKSGKAGQGYISKEVFEQNKHNQKWMDANYDNIVSSMNKWSQ